jgi:hypothetical protein
MDIDETKLELLERRLAEKIENQVRKRIFGIYGTIAAGILAAFSYFGYDVISSIEPTVTEAATNAATKQAFSKIDPIMESVKKKAQEAQELAIRNEIELAALERFRNEARNRLNLTLGKVEDATQSIEFSLVDLREKLEGAREDVEGFRKRSEDLFLPAGYEKDILELSQDVLKLSEILKGLTDGVQVSDLQPIDVEGTQGTLDRIKTRVDDATTLPGSTVYVQFAGVPRIQIQELTTFLKQDGYIVPGEERITAAAGKAEVRYFYSEDRSEARKLAERVNSALEQLGLKQNVEDRFVNLSKGTPRKGVLELWIEPRRN